MKNVASRRRRVSKGSAIIETSLIFIAFAAIMIGIFDFSQFLFVHSALVERARFAARWGAINNPTDSTSITNMVLYNQSSSPSSGTAGYFNLTSSNVSVTTPGSGSNDYRLVVTISGYSYLMLSPWVAGSHTGVPITVAVPLGIFD